MFFILKNGGGCPQPPSLVMALFNKPLKYMYRCAHHGKSFIRSHAKSKSGFWTNGINFINWTLTKLQLIHSEADARFVWMGVGEVGCCIIGKMQRWLIGSNIPNSWTLSSLQGHKYIRYDSKANVVYILSPSSTSRLSSLFLILSNSRFFPEFHVKTPDNSWFSTFYL